MPNTYDCPDAVRLSPLTARTQLVTIQAQSLTLRLCAEDLVRGGIVSSQQGGVQRLWVIKAINEGAGDGCVEVQLVPRTDPYP